MTHTARLFTNGNTQAVRIPAEFKFDCDEVYIRQVSETEDLVLSKKPDSWEGFFKLIPPGNDLDDFLNERENEIPPQRDLF